GDRLRRLAAVDGALAEARVANRPRRVAQLVAGDARLLRVVVRLDGAGEVSRRGDVREDVVLLVPVGGLRVDGEGEARHQHRHRLGNAHLAELVDRLLARVATGLAVFLHHLRLELERLLRGRATTEEIEDSHGRALYQSFNPERTS